VRCLGTKATEPVKSPRRNLITLSDDKSLWTAHHKVVSSTTDNGCVWVVYGEIRPITVEEWIFSGIGQLLMVQDFAKIRPEPVLEKRAMEAPPAWTLLLTGVVTGIAIGVFACFLLYLSGNIPPLQQPPVVTVTETETPPVVTLTPDSQVEESSSLTLDFYQELPEYEVRVDATPLAIEPEEEQRSTAAAAPQVTIETVPTQSSGRSESGSRLLQIGAFQQITSARTQVAMLEDLGVAAVIKDQAINGRTLHLVQAGPFTSEAELDSVRTFLKRNDINSFPLVQR